MTRLSHILNIFFICHLPLPVVYGSNVQRIKCINVSFMIYGFGVISAKLFLFPR